MARTIASSSMQAIVGWANRENLALEQVRCVSSETSRQDALRAAIELPGRLSHLPIAAASWLTAWLRGARPLNEVAGAACHLPGRDDMMIVMSAQNECVEYQRLQRAYDDAIIVWEQDRLPHVRPIDRQKLSKGEAAELRDQALSKRNIAANELYKHLTTCPTCKHFKK